MEDVNKLHMTLEEILESNRKVGEDLARINAELDRLSPPATIPNVVTYNEIPRPCRSCPNHPSNGGSGICHCILGSQTVY